MRKLKRVSYKRLIGCLLLTWENLGTKLFLHIKLAGVDELLDTSDSSFTSVLLELGLKLENETEISARVEHGSNELLSISLVIRFLHYVSLAGAGVELNLKKAETSARVNTASTNSSSPSSASDSSITSVLLELELEDGDGDISQDRTRHQSLAGVAGSETKLAGTSSGNRER